MMSGYFGRSHILFCDNYYSSLRLFIDLWQLGVGGTGTVRQSREGFHKSLKAGNWAGMEEIVVFKSRQLTITAYSDAKPVFVMSTVYSSKNIPSGKTDPRTHMPVTHPHVVVMYNIMMGRVDHSAPMLAYSRVPGKTMKWWKQFFFTFSAWVC